MSDTFTVKIAAEARPAVEKTVVRLERMHARRGLLFAASWSEEYEQTHRIKHSTKQVPLSGTVATITQGRWTGKVANFRYYDLTLMMSPLSDDWELLYTVSPANPNDLNDAEAIIMQNPTSDEEHEYPTHFHDRCDHCNGRRGRHKTMTFRHKESQEIVSVGSTCVLEYTGIDPSLIESILEFKGKATTHDFDTGTRGAKSTMTTYEFALRASMWLHANEGYTQGLGRNLFNYDLIKHPQTGQIGFGYHQLVPASTIIAAPAGGITEPVGFQWLREQEPAVAPEAMSPSVFTVAEAFMDYCVNLSGSSSFEHTVRNIFKSGIVSGKSSAMAGGALAGYLKHIQREARKTVKVEREAAKPSGVHRGTVGERSDFGPATVVFVRRIEGYYGTTTLTKFLAGDDTLVWFRSGDKSDLAVGDTVSITGTVKKHDQFKDEKQTVITRAKFTRGEE